MKEIVGWHVTEIAVVPESVVGPPAVQSHTGQGIRASHAGPSFETATVFCRREYALAGSLPGRITYRNLLSLVNILCKQAERHQIKEALTGFNLQVEKTLSNTVCILRCAQIC